MATSRIHASHTLSQVRSTLPAYLRKKSTVRGMLAFCLGYGAYLLTVAGFLLLPWWWLQLLSGILTGVAIARLFVLGHEACHGTLVADRRLNGFLGRLAFLPGLHAFNLWDIAHNRTHHRYTNLAGRDTTWAPLSRVQYEGMSRFQQFLERSYRSGWGFGLYYLKIWRQTIVSPAPTPEDRRRNRQDQTLVLAYCLAQVTLLVLAPRYLPVAASAASMPIWFCIAGGFFLPLLVLAWILGFATYVQHTHESVAWYAPTEWTFFRGQIESTVHVQMPWIIRLLFSNVMEHTAHHVDPRIPFYRLEHAQKLLERAYPDRIRAPRWSWQSYLRTLSICKLYDYENHRWLNFAGRPTGECTLQK